jgi:membrane-associated protein
MPQGIVSSTLTASAMSADFITEIILQYRYWILIPLTFIEGPVVAFVAGTLAAVGLFNIYFLAILFFVRDVGMDVIYYAIGHFGGHTAFAERMLKKIGVTPDHLEDVRILWEKRPGWTMFIGKLSYGIAAAFIVVAGMVKMPFHLFLKYGILVAILQYGVLLFAGYFLGESLGGSITHILSNVQYAIAAVALAISAYYIFSWYMRRKFLANEVE